MIPLLLLSLVLRRGAAEAPRWGRRRRGRRCRRGGGGRRRRWSFRGLRCGRRFGFRRLHSRRFLRLRRRPCPRSSSSCCSSLGSLCGLLRRRRGKAPERLGCLAPCRADQRDASSSAARALEGAGSEELLGVERGRCLCRSVAAAFSALPLVAPLLPPLSFSEGDPGPGFLGGHEDRDEALRVGRLLPIGTVVLTTAARLSAIAASSVSACSASGPGEHQRQARPSRRHPQQGFVRRDPPCAPPVVGRVRPGDQRPVGLRGRQQQDVAAAVSGRAVPAAACRLGAEEAPGGGEGQSEWGPTTGAGAPTGGSGASTGEADAGEPGAEAADVGGPGAVLRVFEVFFFF